LIIGFNVWGEPLPGYVWLDTPGKVLHVEAARLEFRDDPPA
jgi:hypothetical protein